VTLASLPAMIVGAVTAPDPPSRVPWYRATLTALGVAFVLLAAMNAARGPRDVLSPFGFPAAELDAPLLRDFWHWLFVHMGNLGVLLVLLGQLVKGARGQAIVAFTLLGLLLHYGWLDFRTSYWGDGLYDDPASGMLLAFDAAFVLAVAHVCLRAILTLRSAGGGAPGPGVHS
jgi:hypothetical protein